MAFPTDERVIMHYYTGNPLVNGESHFTASFGGSWLLKLTVEINCSKLLEWLVQNKLNRGLRQQIYPNWQGSHLNGEQLQRG